MRPASNTTRAIAARLALTAAPALAALVILGCSADRRSIPVVERDSAGVAISSSSTPSSEPHGWTLDSVPSVQIGVAEGEEQYQLFRVRSALILDDGRIVISNAGTHEIRVFNPAGEFLYSFGRNGQGPGEFGAFSSMRVYRFRGDTLAITDGANGRLNLYSRDGQFGRTVSMTASERFGRPGVFGHFEADGWFVIGAVGSGILQGAPGERIDMERAYLAIPIDGEPRVLAVVDGRPRVVNELGGVTHYPYVPLTPDPSAAVDGQSLLVAHGVGAEVQRINLAGEITAIYRWELPARPVSEIWDRFQDAYLGDIDDEDDRRRYARFLERDLPIPETVPAVESVAVDRFGDIWALRYSLPWESEATWDVLSPEGHWLATIAMPASFDVLEFGGDRVLVREVDDLGIERVSLYRLHRDRFP